MSHPSVRPRKLSFTSGFTLFARIWTNGSRTAAGGHFYTWFATLKTANGNKPCYGYYCIVNVDKRRAVPPLKLPKITHGCRYVPQRVFQLNFVPYFGNEIREYGEGGEQS